MKSSISIRIAILTLIILVSSLPAFSDWTSVGEGIEYRKFALPDPNNVYVARMAIQNKSATIESSLPQGKLTGARQNIRLQSGLLDDAINWWGREWGKRNEVVVAINGDWIYLNTGVMYGGQAHSGWYAKPIYCEFGGAQFAWTQNRELFIGGIIGHASQQLSVAFNPSGETQTIQGINRTRGENELIIYTPQLDSSTNTEANGTEVLVQLAQPAGIGETKGIVREIRRNQEATLIPFDHVVLSAEGSAAEKLLANITEDMEVSISLNFEMPGGENFNWRETYASISGGRLVVQNGEAVDNSADAVYAGIHPRTAVAFNDTYVYFVVCDGRMEESRGMSSRELSDFLIGTLGAKEALMLDGGGSSTMVIRGEVVNVPSAGAERAVGNGLMMVNLKEKSQSTKFRPDQSVSTVAKTDLRLGPGDNFGLMATIEAGVEGVIVPHSLNGIRARGQNWRKANFGGKTGWIAEEKIEAK